jgi:hypothetical protein
MKSDWRTSSGSRRPSARRANHFHIGHRHAVHTLAQKYSARGVGQISDLIPRVSPVTRGGSRSSRTRGGMRWTRNARDVRAGNVRRSRVVLTPRCWRQVTQKYLRGDSGKRAVHWGEHEVSRKATAQGRPECSAEPVCSCAFLFAQLARETAGAACTRSSLRPRI